MVQLNLKVGLMSLLALAPVGQAANFTLVTEDFGPNPRGVGFYIYVPDQLAASPPVLVNPHWCHGAANDTYIYSQYANLADQHGFIVIYPDSPNLEDKCWDVSSNETLTHDGGGDSLGIVSMVRGLPSAGQFEGSQMLTGLEAMMTNVLLGAYPDVFAAGSAWAGVPFGCFAGDGYDVWSNACATGEITHTPAEWASIVHAAYPGYNGWRPKFQLFHGTVDQVLNFTNFGEAIKEWTAVFGLSERPTGVTSDWPKTDWTRYTYGNDWFEATSALNVTHDIGTNETVVMDWFDLGCTTGDCFKWGRGGPSNCTAYASKQNGKHHVRLS
ncbi:hypothetical protein TruAng_012076 [Truncatella angustata]|nr:hypothetical protein TruAng_012076 [Truncatella angustata]